MHSTELHSTAYPPPEGDVKKGVDEANSPKSSYPFFGIHVKGKPRLEKFQNTFMTRLRPVYYYVAMAEQQPKNVVGQGLDRHANLRTPSMDVEGLIKDQSLALVACNVLLHQFEAWGTVSTLLAT
ncbi:predicted protein [Histoplasma capsulatum var. duboisii H88]|uniref:Predicted protein n=2 Tax=Ajellomyces capsulatus TaxID=5037 RepID=F0UVJ4_AJEC8|nr:predicted protein [Histoplasma capsulatum H143]EGC49921.1 predicted protein [Histoplasma capsulatum var. duboisii H88]